MPKLRQSGDFETFRCIGADCEDNCCGDWGVPIDRETYEKYQACDDPELQPALHRFVTIDNASGSNQDFARIGLVNNRCPFLAESLCSIQRKLGESYLSNSCASYPRALVEVDGIVERSLHLSCPEAARLVLLNRGPYEWKEQDRSPDSAGRVQPLATFDSQYANRAGTPYPHFQEVRELFLRVLQATPYTRWQRLAIMARLAEEFNALNCAQPGRTAEFVQRSLTALRTGTFSVRRPREIEPLMEIETVLELIVARISSDFTTPRFLECYREFMQGIGWGPESTMEEIAHRYSEACLRSYTPFMSRHAYLLDNFLINYAIRTIFPYGHRDLDQQLRISYVENAIERQYLLLAVHYAAVRMVLIGMAAFHGPAFGTEHVVKLVQSYTKAFQHSTSYPGKALDILAAKGIHRPSQAVVLFQD